MNIPAGYQWSTKCEGFTLYRSTDRSNLNAFVETPTGEIHELDLASVKAEHGDDFKNDEDLESEAILELISDLAAAD